MAYSPIEESYMNGYVATQFTTPEPEMEPTLLASADTGVTTDGGAFVGTRLKVPKPGQPTPEDRSKMAVGLLDTLAGALRGAAAQTIGLPGDIRSILDLINKEGAEKYLGQAVLPTTEDMLAGTALPPVLKEGVPNREERQKAVDVAQEVGTFLPAPGAPEAAIQGAKMVGKAIKATKNMPIGMSTQIVSPEEANKLIEKIKTFPPFNEYQASDWIATRGLINVLCYDQLLTYHYDTDNSIYNAPMDDVTQYSITIYLNEVSHGGEFWIDSDPIFLYQPVENTAFIFNGGCALHGVNANKDEQHRTRKAITFRIVHKDSLLLLGSPDKFLYKTHDLNEVIK